MSDLETAVPGAGGANTTQPTGTTAPPAREGGAPAPSSDRAIVADDYDDNNDVGDDGDDDGDLFVGGDEDLDAEQDGEPEPSSERQNTAALLPWMRPPNLSEDELAEWKEAQGLPVSAEDYEDKLELPEGTQITEAGRPLVASFLEFAAANDLPASAVSKAIVWFNEQAGARGAAIKERDSASKEEATEALRDRWEDAFDDNLVVATAGLQALPEPLQKLLRAARGPDGRRLLHDPEMAQLLFDLGARSEEGASGARREEADYGDGRAELRAELAELHALRNSDIDAYRTRPYNNSRMTASDRAVEIGRQLGRKTLPNPRQQQASLEAEEAELLSLRDRDADVFEFGDWKGTGRPPIERLDDIRTGRAKPLSPKSRSGRR